MRFVTSPGMPGMRRQLAVAAVVLALFLCGRARAQQAVLDQVPADAVVVVKVKNLNQTSRKVAKMAKELGLDQMAPDWADPLGALEQKSKLTKGVNKDGDFAFVFLNPDVAGGDPEKSMLLLVPVSDYQAFVGNFKNPQAQGEVTKASPQDANEELYLAHWGNYAAITPTNQLLAKKPAGLKLQGVAAKESDAKDALLYVNMAAVKAHALPALQQNRDQVMKEVENGLNQAGDAGKKFTPVVKAVVNQAMTYAERFLNECRSATLGLNLSDAGLTSTFMLDFQPTGFFGGVVSGIKNTDQPLVAGLPNRQYFMVLGSAGNPQTANKVMSDFFDPITKELANVPEGKSIAGMVDAMKKMTAATTGSSIGWVAPTGGLGEESILQQVSVMHGDATALQAGIRQMLQNEADLMKMLPQQEGMSMSFDFQPGAKTVGGAKFDRFETKMKMDENNPAAAQMKQVMAWIYGPTGNTGVIGQVDPKTVLMVVGGGDPLINDAVAAAKAGTAPLANNAGVKAVAAQLPKQRAGEFYLKLDTIIGTGIRYAKGLGLPVPVKLNADLPPIGATVSSEQSAVRVDTFVPMDLVKGLVGAGMEAMKEMQKPGGGL